jgi:hypothetical protein
LSKKELEEGRERKGERKGRGEVKMGEKKNGEGQRAWQRGKGEMKGEKKKEWRYM